uniref:Uncharacterized protein n=1 Tax=Cacopsylla melanoneura TaxID=428564 RepID=A0A8D8Z4B3_9HEMI
MWAYLDVFGLTLTALGPNGRSVWIRIEWSPRATRMYVESRAGWRRGASWRRRWTSWRRRRWTFWRRRTGRHGRDTVDDSQRGQEYVQFGDGHSCKPIKCCLEY